MTNSLIHKKNAEFHDVVVVCVDEARDVSLVHALAVELEHGLAIVGFDFNADVCLGCEVAYIVGV
jgi:hypothetical protein